MRNKIFLADNLEVLRQMDSESVDLIFVDIPFNTGKVQSYSRKTFIQNDDSNRIGFGDKNYQVLTTSEPISYSDNMSHEDYYDFLRVRLLEAKRVLKQTGSLYLQIDYREVHYVKVLLLDEIFGRNNFQNNLIWAYEWGAKTKRKWPTKHDDILFYSRNNENYYFDIDAVERIPYLSPALVGAEKAERGKTVTDVHWLSVIGTNAKERTGYPTQKPVALIERFIQASCPINGLVLDFFCGSGSTGAACLKNNRYFVMVDNNPDAFDLMKQRFQNEKDIDFINSATGKVFAL